MAHGGDTSHETAFQTLPLREPQFLDRILRRPSKENAWIELNNMLANAKSPEEVTAETVDNLSQKYGVELRKMFVRELQSLHAKYIGASDISGGFFIGWDRG